MYPANVNVWRSSKNGLTKVIAEPMSYEQLEEIVKDNFSMIFRQYKKLNRHC